MQFKGIAFKTFLFTSALIALVIALSFGILYFTLPDYYLYMKQNLMERNADALVKNLNEVATQEQCSQIIAEFSQENNADVMALNADSEIIAPLSSPFVHMKQADGNVPYVSIVFTGDDDRWTHSIKLMQQGQVLSEDAPMPDDVIVETTEAKKATILSASYARAASSAMINDRREVSNGIIDYVDITFTLQPIGEAKLVIMSLIPYLLLLDIVIALIAAYFYARQFTRPILKISAAAADMQRMEPGVVCGVQTGDELGELSDNLDSLYSHLCANIEDLRTLERSKTDFMRAAGHELKTPIAALSGIVEGMMDNVGVYKNKEKYLGESKMLIDRLAGLVSEILDASKLEDVEYSYSDVSVRELIDDALQCRRLFIEEKELRIFEGDFDVVLHTDRRLIGAAISNIISNAVSYTNKGGVINIAYCSESGQLSIENSCANISEDLLPRLFEPFYTLNYSRTKNESGTGLGLYIVKRNLEALKLPYFVENTEIGVRFIVCLLSEL